MKSIELPELEDCPNIQGQPGDMSLLDNTPERRDLYGEGFWKSVKGPFQPG